MGAGAARMAQQARKLQLGEELQLQQLARTRALERDLLQMRVEDTQLLHRARQQFLEGRAALEREARQREAAGALWARIQATSVGADRGPLRPELPPSHRAQALRNQPRQLPDHGELEDTRGLACVHGVASLAPLGQSDTSNAGSKLPPLSVSHRPARVSVSGPGSGVASFTPSRPDSEGYTSKVAYTIPTLPWEAPPQVL